MKSTREYNYDWLRVVSMIAVIMIHVSGSWVNSFSGYVSDGGNVTELLSPMASCVYNTIPRFAVPCFIMLSGAFVLADSKTAYYREFYRKTFMKIGVPTIVFSVIYILYRLSLCLVGEQAGMKEMLDLMKDIVVGAPFYHMWYLFMMLEIYLLAPIVIRFKDSIKYEQFRKVAFVFLVLGSLSGWTTENVRLNWDIGQSFEYLGYFMVGYVIRRDLHKNNYRGTLLIGLGFLMEIAMAFIVYRFRIVNGMSEGELEYQISNPYSPMIVIVALLIFAGFTMLKMKYNVLIEKLARMSFVIYLFHAGVWDFLVKVMYKIENDTTYLRSLNNIYWIPICVGTVLILSVLLTIIYQKIEVYIMPKVKNGKEF